MVKSQHIKGSLKTTVGGCVCVGWAGWTAGTSHCRFKWVFCPLADISGVHICLEQAVFRIWYTSKLHNVQYILFTAYYYLKWHMKRCASRFALLSDDLNKLQVFH